MSPLSSQIVPPVPTCRKCGAPAPRFLRKCPRCGRRSLRLGWLHGTTAKY